MKTYGKQNAFIKQAREIKNIFKPSRHTINLIKGVGCEIYQPKFNKIKLSFAGVVIVACLVTPATNWLIPFVMGWGLS